MSLFGKMYKLFTFGQSHSAFTGCVIQGFPSNFALSLDQIQKQLNRRRPGQSTISTLRKEKDQVQCISGMQNGKTLGSPLCFMVKNEDVKKSDYNILKNVPRPGHADYTYLKKYGIKAQSGGGRASARETIGRVIAGAVAKQYLKSYGIQFGSWVFGVGNNYIPQNINKQLSMNQKLNNQSIEQLDPIKQYNDHLYSYEKAGKSYVYDIINKTLQQQHLNQQNSQQLQGLLPNMRCPHQPTAIQIFQSVKKVQLEGDSLGGIIQSCVYNLPVGLGEPVFDKFQALMAHAMLSIPSVKGFEFGSGFHGTKLKGSQHNDLFNQNMMLQSNNSGGTLGGITTGETFHFKVAFKPVSSISKIQRTSTYDGELIDLQVKGRHDPCVLPRAPAIVDSMAAIVIMQLMMRHKGQNIMKK